MLEQGRDRKVTNKGGSRKCMLVKEAIRVKEVQRMVIETIGNDLSVCKLWYSLKYDTQMLMLI